jgi:ribosomal protein S1
MVKLDPEIHGLAHISELSDSAIADVNQLREMYKVGESYPFEIVSIEPAEHRLGLKREGVKGKTHKKAKDEDAEKKESTVVEETK